MPRKSRPLRSTVSSARSPTKNASTAPPSPIFPMSAPRPWSFTGSLRSRSAQSRSPPPGPPGLGGGGVVGALGGVGGGGGARGVVVGGWLGERVGPAALAAARPAGLRGGVVDGAFGDDADDVAFLEVNAGVHPLLVGGDLDVFAQAALGGGGACRGRAGTCGRRGAGGRAHRRLHARRVGAAGADRKRVV